MINLYKIVYPIFYYRKYRAIKKNLKNQYLSFSEISILQEKKFLKLIEHVKKNVPYYSSLLNNIEISSINDISKIPFLTKNMIKNNMEQMKAVNFKDKYFIPNSTSGSTGKATYFFSDITNYYGPACAMRGDMWAGWNLGEKSVILWGAFQDIKTNKSLINIIKGKIKNRIILSSFNMTDGDMKTYLNIINNYKPVLIVGYPSSLEFFSKFIKKKNFAVHSPKGIVTGGETLYEDQRELIQEIFKSKVLNRYGGREIGHIANECERQNGLHISSDHVIVEIIDENGNPAKKGELGEIVLTDLDNYAFPFIRYRVGDLGILSDRKCSCGRELPLLEKVEGRTFDIVVGINGNRVSGTFWTLLRHKIKGIEKFQVIQNEIEKITMKIIVNKDFKDTQRNKLESIIREKLGRKMLIDIQMVDEIALTTTSGKFRWVISQVSPFNKI